MKKEIIICIIVVIAISIGNIITQTQQYTKESVSTLSNDLEELKLDLNNKIKNEEEKTNEELSNSIDKITKDWESRHYKLAYYIEHNELEKVEDNLTGLDSLVSTEEYAEAIKELDKCIFILRHIEEKYAFNLENIF